MKPSYFRKATNAVAAALIMIAVASCNKDNSLSSSPNTSSIQTDAVLSQAIAVAVNASGDSVYVMNACGKGSHKDSVAYSALPSMITTYLSGNYNTYTFQKAYAVKDTTGKLSGYVVVILFNGKPVGLQFDATGNFVKVLEQREKVDMRNDHGWHNGGYFDNRDGRNRDTVALSSLSSSIRTYFITNYPQDTLVRAFRNRDSSIVVLSINQVPFATIFSKTGGLIKRTQLPAHPGKASSVEQNNLPPAAIQYLSATYPNYVFEHAFKITGNNTSQGYAVFIDANNTKYAVEFDASGLFIQAVALR